MSRTQLFIFSSLGVLVIIAGLIFFGPARKPAAPPEASLTFWGVRDDDRVWRDIIQKFKEKNPHLDVTYQRFDEATYEAVLINRLAENRGPDVFMLKNSWLLEHRDKITPLTDVFRISTRNISDSFVDEAATTLTSSDGRIFGLTTHLDTLLLFYNKDIFNTAGIASPPQTWEEVETVSRATARTTPAGDVTRAGIALGSSEKTEYAFEILSALMLQRGAAVVNRNTGQIELGRQAEEALRFYASFADIRNDNYSWRDGARTSLEAFAEGNAAMAIGFAQDITRIRARNPHLNLGLASFPQMEGAKVAIAYPEYFFLTVSKLSQNPGPAWQFALFAASEDGAKIYTDGTLRPPARRDLISGGAPTADLDISYRQSLTARGWPVPDEKASRRLFNEAITAVNTRTRTPAEAINRTQEQLRLLNP